MATIVTTETTGEGQGRAREGRLETCRSMFPVDGQKKTDRATGKCPLTAPNLLLTPKAQLQ
jgi:hypothetical protein